MIAIIDYDAGNIKSVEKALNHLGQETILTRNFHEILRADKVILPGVGSFGDAMAHLKKYELDRAIREVVAEKKPFLGICLGLQLLFEASQETEGVEGLGILKGQCLRIPETGGLKIPHIGWNSLDFPSEGRLFSGISEGAYVYFVHSYPCIGGKGQCVCMSVPPGEKRGSRTGDLTEFCGFIRDRKREDICLPNESYHVWTSRTAEWSRVLIL